MPKAKPDQVVVHRIELQEKEREMVEHLIVGQTVKNVVIPAAITVGVGSAAYIGYKTAKSIAGWTHDIVDDIKATPVGTYAQAASTTGNLAGMPPAVQGMFKLSRWLFGK